MTSLEKLKQTSMITRRLLFAVMALVVGIACYGLATEGNWWVAFGNANFNTLWHTHLEARTTLAMAIFPLMVALLLGFYFLQRLLFEFSRGAFFSTMSMRCLKWLAWLSFFSVLYNIVLTPVAGMLVAPLQAVEIRIQPLTLVFLLCFPVLVHLFSAASELDQDAKEII